MPTPSLRYRNWTGVAFATIAINGIKSLGLDDGIQDLREAADADLGPSHTAVIFQEPVFNITTINAMALRATAAGVKGVFTATLNDSYNGTGTGSGSWTYTTNSSSYIRARQVSGAFNALADQTLSIGTTWPDGTTNPVSVAQN